MRTLLLTLLPLLFLVFSVHAADTATELLQKAQAALQKGQGDEAIDLAGKAITLDPKAPLPYLVRGSIYEKLRRHAPAVADYTKAIELNPKEADAYNRRGSEQFCQGKIAESLADFDKFLEMRPKEGPGHWKRGISCYYLGKFKEGKKQFEDGEAVFPDDVENAVWHFLCNARLVGVEKARASLLKIGKDKRIPMMEVYAVFTGKAKPADVLTAAKAGNPPAARLNAQLFYGHLYLGLYAEAMGDKKEALEQMTEAVKHKVGHYMWDVAAVHKNLLEKTNEKAK